MLYDRSRSPKSISVWNDAASWPDARQVHSNTEQLKHRYDIVRVRHGLEKILSCTKSNKACRTERGNAHACQVDSDMHRLRVLIRHKDRASESRVKEGDRAHGRMSDCYVSIQQSLRTTVSFAYHWLTHLRAENLTRWKEGCVYKSLFGKSWHIEKLVLTWNECCAVACIKNEIWMQSRRRVSRACSHWKTWRRRRPNISKKMILLRLTLVPVWFKLDTGTCRANQPNRRRVGVPCNRQAVPQTLL